MCSIIIDEYLSADMSYYSIGENGYIFRADENLVVTASNKADMIGKTLPELGFPVEAGKEYSESFTVNLDGQKTYAYGDNSLGFFIFYAFTEGSSLVNSGLWML